MDLQVTALNKAYNPSNFAFNKAGFQIVVNASWCARFESQILSPPQANDAWSQISPGCKLPNWVSSVMAASALIGPVLSAAEAFSFWGRVCQLCCCSAFQRRGRSDIPPVCPLASGALWTYMARPSAT